MRARWTLPIACLAAGAFVASCGGGSPSGDETPRITDPNTAPTATGLAGAVKYEIRGNSVSIPGGTTTATTGTPGPSGETYTVASGESCGVIADKLGTTTEALMEANPEINEGCTNLQPGDELKVPAAAAQATSAPGTTATARPTTASGSGETYVVESGDTCADIAASYGVDVEDLRALNGLDSECSLAVGQELEIP